MRAAIVIVALPFPTTVAIAQDPVYSESSCWDSHTGGAKSCAAFGGEVSWIGSTAGSGEFVVAPGGFALPTLGGQLL